MDKFFRVPFATSGDQSPVPDAADVNGNVSYTEGYGPDYQLPDTDPDAKNIERDKMNNLFFEITTALQEQQSLGVPDFITSALNGGAAYSYALNAMVRWTDNQVYLSLTAANNADPTDATKWALLPTAALIQQQAYSAASGGGTANAITASFTPAITTLAGQCVLVRLTAANTSTTPTFQANATAAKTIVKDNNQPLLAGDLPGAGAWAQLKHDVVLDKWVLLNPALPFPALLTTSGWQKLPSGLIFQWGTVNQSTAQNVSVTFPIPFPTAVLNTTASSSNSTGTLNGASTYGQNLAGMAVALNANYSFTWMAIGI